MFYDKLNFIAGFKLVLYVVFRFADGKMDEQVIPIKLRNDFNLV